MTKTVTIGERTFQVRKVPAYPDQMLLAKVVMPVWQDVLPLIIRVITTPELKAAIQAGTPPTDFLIEVMDIASGAIRKLSEDDLLALTRRALATVQIKQGDAGWADVMLASGQMMFPLELGEIIELIWEAVGVNLGGFFIESLGKSQGVKPKG